MTNSSGETLEQRRKHLQEELALQRALVMTRLAPKMEREAVADHLKPEHAMPGVGAGYPRSMTMRLAQKNPAVAVGLVALGAAMLLRGRRSELDNILSVAKSVEPWFRT
jgi:hypothetical protein